jgi:hypothetical protein
VTRPALHRGGRLVAQFLEGGSNAANLAPEEAVALLRQALTQLPLTDLCLGWRLPAALLRAVTTFVRNASSATVWLWHPLLTGEGSEPIRDEDLAIGPAGDPLREAVDAFSFVCPNRKGAMTRAMHRLRADLAGAAYDGVFLDRIRWPSPARAPDRLLACFCDACASAAATDGLDLGRVAREVGNLSRTLAGRRQLVAALLGGPAPELIDRFLRWRALAVGTAVERSITAARQDRRALRFALDVFSPTLARMVGQDLATLAPRAEWTKAMIYSTVHAPAGLPYELGGLLRWLGEAGDLEGSRFLSELTGYRVPPTPELESVGLGTDAVRAEIMRLRRECGGRGAAGIEAVAIPAVATMTEPMLRERLHIAADLRVSIVLSWDLALVPPEWVVAIGAEVSQSQEG